MLLVDPFEISESASDSSTSVDGSHEYDSQ